MQGPEPMNKKAVIFAVIAVVVLALACAAVFLHERAQVADIIDDEAAWDLRDASPQKKVIITEGGMVARYLTEEGTRPAYAAPDSLSEVVGELRFECGYCPESYSCKGYRDGWFAIEIEGVTGYVSEEYVWWDAIDTN